MVNWQGRCNSAAWISDRLTPHLCRDALNTTTAHLADLLPELPPPSLTIDLWKTTTLHQFHDTLTPPLIQSTIDSWKITTPNLADLLADIYSTMHIYLWPIYSHPLLQSSIDTLNTATPNLVNLMTNLYK